MGSPQSSVETPRLLLRVPELKDAEPLMGIIWDPEVVARKQVTLFEPPGGLDLAIKNCRETIRQWELRGYGQWSVVEKATGQLIDSALEWAWAHTPITRVISLIGPDDLRSIRIATKIGEHFERAGVDPVNGEPVHVYTIARP